MAKKQKNYKVINALLSVILLTVVIITAVVVVRDGKNSVSEPFGSTDEVTTRETTETTETTSETATSTTEVTAAITTTQEVTVSRVINEETGRIIIDPEQEQWNLVVVNTSREMPEGYEPELAEVCSSGKYLRAEVAPYYNAMYEAAKAEGIILTPYSAYRSYERQKNNYNNLVENNMSWYNLTRQEAQKKAATVILPPGTSEHNLGLAMDICSTDDEFKDTAEYAWLTENAYKYGFILRYTADKQDITGIISEPWHWRFVGTEYAEDIMNSGLCLEEYLDSKGIAY